MRGEFFLDLRDTSSRICHIQASLLDHRGPWRRCVMQSAGKDGLDHARQHLLLQSGRNWDSEVGAVESGDCPLNNAI